MGKKRESVRCAIEKRNDEITEGLIDADLGRGLVKKRVAKSG